MQTHSSQPQINWSLETWLSYLTKLHRVAIDLGLDRVKKVAQKGQLIKVAPKIITVAGTNGKGSTCAILENILLQAGYRVGVYSSPHLIHYNERVRLQGKNVTDEMLCHAFHQIESFRNNIDFEQAISLSFFEFGTLAALQIFKQEKLDVVILEVGLGGRLDATNIVEHDVSVITSLGLDHLDWLGSDIEQIGFEKAGIFRPHRAAICGQENPPTSVKLHANQIEANFYQVNEAFNYQINKQEANWQWQSNNISYSHLPMPQLPLKNAATALMALQTLGLELTEDNIKQGLRNASLPGRMQLFSHQPDVILDVAHNPQAAQYLVQALMKKYPTQKIKVVVGMLKDKDIQTTIEVLAPIVTLWYPCTLKEERGATAQDIAAFLPKEKTAGKFDSPMQGVKEAYLALAKDEVLLVVGSFHTIGQVLAHQADFSV